MSNQYNKLEEEEGAENIVNENFIPLPYRQEGMQEENEKEEIPDPRSFKAQSLEEQLRLQEELNKVQLEKAKNSRKYFRILILIIGCVVIVGGFILIKKYLAFGKGNIALESGSNLEIVMANCSFEILKTNSTTAPPLQLVYYVPGMFNIDLNGPTSNATVNFNSTSSDCTCNFTNILDKRSCYARLYVHNESNSSLMNLNNINFTCEKNSECLFIWKANQFSVSEGVTIRGDSVYLNAENFTAGFIDFEATKGLVQLNEFHLAQGGEIHIDYGDIIGQSLQDFSLN